MNTELVDELYGKAFHTILNPYVDKNGTARYNVSDHIDGRTRLLFAEFIVRECLELTLDYRNDNHYSGWIEYRDKIREHFGIED